MKTTTHEKSHNPDEQLEELKKRAEKVEQDSRELGDKLNALYEKEKSKKWWSRAINGWIWRLEYDIGMPNDIDSPLKESEVEHDRIAELERQVAELQKENERWQIRYETAVGILERLLRSSEGGSTENTETVDDFEELKGKNSLVDKFVRVILVPAIGVAIFLIIRSFFG